jgi:citrate lyase subunit beta/citryl-CoA lyase
MQTTSSGPAALADARTLLFVPGHRADRFLKALASGADAVVIDLEDAVPPELKVTARLGLQEAWAEVQAAGVPVVIRINNPRSPWGEADLSAVAALSPPPAALMVPKAESAGDVRWAREAVPQAAVLPLIESAEGLDALREIAAAEGVQRLVVGHIDFMADTGLRCSADERELDPLRFAVALQTRVHRLAPAIDGVTTAIGDAERLRADTRRALNFGFGGKLCIHPSQVGAVHDAMTPSEEELAWARRVVAADQASGGAAVQLDGRMVDRPVVLQAQRTLVRVRHEAP